MVRKVYKEVSILNTMETLSDKTLVIIAQDSIEHFEKEAPYLKVKDVKDAIKKLKDIIYKTDSDDICGSCQACVSHIIDKLAGPKLT